MVHPESEWALQPGIKSDENASFAVGGGGSQVDGNGRVGLQAVNLNPSMSAWANR